MNRMAQLIKAGASGTLLAAATVLVVACGCQSKHEAEGRGAEEFLPDHQSSAVTRIVDRQVAAGARTDATLRAYHFDHARLNALGREKVDLVLEHAGDEGPLELYVDVSDSDAREAAVMDYLDGRVAPDRVRLTAGPNPNNTFAASAALTAKGKHESGAAGTAVGQGLGEGGGFGASGDMSAPQN